MPFEPKLIEFLRETVAAQLYAFPKAELEYYGFLTIMQGIEVAGSIFDGEPADDYGQCENRFEKGFCYLFPNAPYNGEWKSFFQQLRGPIVHQLRPGWDFTLTCERKYPRDKHFTKDMQMQTVLVLEVFIDDFRAGLDRIMEEINNGTLKGKVDESKPDGRHIITYGLDDGGKLDLTNDGLSARPNYNV